MRLADRYLTPGSVVGMALFGMGFLLKTAGFRLHSESFLIVGALAFVAGGLLGALTTLAQGLKQSAPFLGGVNAALFLVSGAWLAGWCLWLPSMPRWAAIALVSALVLCALGWIRVDRSESRKR
jgi:hypothetical protein